MDGATAGLKRDLLKVEVNLRAPMSRLSLSRSGPFSAPLFFYLSSISLLHEGVLDSSLWRRLPS